LIDGFSGAVDLFTLLRGGMGGGLMEFGDDDF
jgi:hypothetical protein